MSVKCQLLLSHDHTHARTRCPFASLKHNTHYRCWIALILTIYNHQVITSNKITLSNLAITDCGNRTQPLRGHRQIKRIVMIATAIWAGSREKVRQLRDWETILVVDVRASNSFPPPKTINDLPLLLLLADFNDKALENVTYTYIALNLRSKWHQRHLLNFSVQFKSK